MVLRDTKQQVLGMSRQVHEAWEAVGGEAGSIAKDVGVYLYRYGSSHPEMQGSLAGVGHAARRVSIAGGT